MINFAHIHLMINHLPIMTMPVALTFYFYSIYKKSKDFKKFSLFIIIGTAASVIPVYLTGEPAEEVIENLIDVSKNLIKDHEEAAELSLIFTIIAGVMSFIILLWGSKLDFLKKYGEKLVVLTCLLALGFLIYTANMGGKIRHPELRTETNKV
jgi:uncharacterized membrane protein